MVLIMEREEEGQVQNNRAVSCIVISWRDTDGQMGEFACDLQYIPRIGDRISLSTVRDEIGNFPDWLQNDKFIERHVISGVVTSIDHTIREVGRDESQRCWIQEVYIKIQRG
jgi:hypothetical protein